jgi:ribonuclease J
MSKKEKLKIIPLGGLGEVGKNMMAYEYGEDIIVVDAGIMFPKNDMLGIDYIIPDFEYLKDKVNRIRGIIITHGHEDHIGAIQHVIAEFPGVPIYATQLTRGLIEAKLLRNNAQHKANIKTIEAGGKTQLGAFTVEYFHVCHSIPDAVSLAITTPAGLIVHMSDFKFDQTPVDNWPTDYAKLAELSQRGVDLLLSDSTNAERPGWTPSEMVIGPAFDKVFAEAEGRVIVATFASLISRVQQVADAAIKNRRKMAIAGPSMVDNIKIARKMGYLNIPDEAIVPIEQALNMQDHKVVLMCTGSQGEPSSIVGRLSAGTNRQFDLKPGDTLVLSSHPIPGNEESISNIINRVLRRGAKVVHDGVMPIHVSGHAAQEEQKLLISMIQPKHFMPIHGELRMLIRHGELAKQMGVPPENVHIAENGQIVELLAGHIKFGQRIPGGYVFVDGESIGDIDHDIMRERGQLARNGILLIDISLDKFSGRLLHEPEILTRGYVTSEDAEQLIPEVRKRVMDVVNNNGFDNEKDLINAVKSYLHQQTKRTPMVFVTLSKA